MTAEEREKSKEESPLLAALLHVKSVLDVPGKDGVHRYDGHIHAYGCRACSLRDEVIQALESAGGQ